VLKILHHRKKGYGTFEGHWSEIHHRRTRYVVELQRLSLVSRQQSESISERFEERLRRILKTLSEKRRFGAGEQAEGLKKSSGATYHFGLHGFVANEAGFVIKKCRFTKHAQCRIAAILLRVRR